MLEKYTSPIIRAEVYSYTGEHASIGVTAPSSLGWHFQHFLETVTLKGLWSPADKAVSFSRQITWSSPKDHNTKAVKFSLFHAITKEQII
jgi:hypothetical protein